MIMVKYFNNVEKVDFKRKTNDFGGRQKYFFICNFLDGLKPMSELTRTEFY